VTGPRSLRRSHEAPVTRVRSHREPTPQPQPNAVDLLAELVARVAAMEKAQAEHHAEVLDRIDRVEKAAAQAVDTAGCARLDIEEFQPRVRGWLEEVLDTVDGEDGDSPH
jgi:hypothetical protein